MALTQREIRERALAFAHDWADASRERAESQTFWNEFFNIFGITRRRVASFEEPVPRPGRAPGSIDLLKTPDQFSVRLPVSAKSNSTSIRGSRAHLRKPSKLQKTVP